MDRLEWSTVNPANGEVCITLTNNRSRRLLSKDSGFQERDDGETKVVMRLGAQPRASELKRFMVGPVGQELTGFAETPDRRVLFVNVRHPGIGSSTNSAMRPERHTSHWPGHMEYGPGGELSRPRPATVLITKADGGSSGS